MWQPVYKCFPNCVLVQDNDWMQGSIHIDTRRQSMTVPAQGTRMTKD